MRTTRTPVILLAILSVLAAAAAPLLPLFAPPELPKVEAPDFKALTLYRVVSIADGDTIGVQPEAGDKAAPKIEVRLIGIDTPETKDPRKPVQEYGREASAFLANLLKGEHVWLQEDGRKTDKYGRTLAYVYRYPDGLFVNLEVVRQGYGTVLTDYPFKHLDAFRAYADRAREAGKGLYGVAPKADPAGKPPQDQTVTVYGTKSGKKYHADGCTYLSKSKVPMTLAEARAKGLTPCSVCNPPK